MIVTKTVKLSAWERSLVSEWALPLVGLAGTWSGREGDTPERAIKAVLSGPCHRELFIKALDAVTAIKAGAENQARTKFWSDMGMSTSDAEHFARMRTSEVEHLAGVVNVLRAARDLADQSARGADDDNSHAARPAPLDGDIISELRDWAAVDSAAGRIALAAVAEIERLRSVAKKYDVLSEHWWAVAQRGR